MIRRPTYLARMLRNETLTPSALLAHQTQQLCALVHHAVTRVPFYRDLYSAHGTPSEYLRGLPDLPTLPIVDKRLMRAAGRAIRSLDAPAKTVTIRMSGSTGEPFEFQIDRRHDQWRKAQYLRPYLSNGRRLNDKVLRLVATPAQRTPWFSHFGLLREWQIDCAADAPSVVEAWRQIAPDVLQGYPASLGALARYCLETGNALTPVPRLIFADSTLLLQDTRVQRICRRSSVAVSRPRHNSHANYMHCGSSLH